MTAVLYPEDLAEPLALRMKALIESIQPTYPEPIQTAFASQTTAPDESATDERRFATLWIFTSHYVGEIKNPLASGLRINYDIARLADVVDYVRLTSLDYDFKTATEKSQLSLQFSTGDSLSGTISAFGRGCDDLLNVYRERFKVNPKSAPDLESR